MFILVSLFAIEKSRPFSIISSASWLRTPSYANCNFEELGAQNQSSPLGTRQVDLKTNSIRLHNELDHAAAPREVGHVTDRQDACLIERCQNFLKANFFGRTDEQNVAANGVLSFGNALKKYVLALNTLTRDCCAKSRAERVLPKHTNVERAVRRRVFIRPLNELAKVVKVRRLDLIFSRARLSAQEWTFNE